MDNKKTVKVTNRNTGSVGYTIPDLNNLRRQFQPNETKELTFEELTKLSYIPGGSYILKNYLRINDKEVLKALELEVEPEYHLDKEGVLDLLNNGSLDELLDCLDFAPAGVIEMVKSLSVEIDLNDNKKREAIKDKLGFDVSKAIEIKNTREDGKEAKEEHSRRVKIEDKEESGEKKPARRTYKVVG